MQGPNFWTIILSGFSSLLTAVLVVHLSNTFQNRREELKLLSEKAERVLSSVNEMQEVMMEEFALMAGACASKNLWFDYIKDAPFANDRSRKYFECSSAASVTIKLYFPNASSKIENLERFLTQAKSDFYGEASRVYEEGLPIVDLNLAKTYRDVFQESRRIIAEIRSITIEELEMKRAKLGSTLTAKLKSAWEFIYPS